MFVCAIFKARLRDVLGVGRAMDARCLGNNFRLLTRAGNLLEDKYKIDYGMLFLLTSC